MRGFVANIDIEWFTCLRERHPLEGEPLADVRGDAFRALQPGEPLFFRLKRRHYAIGGGVEWWRRRDSNRADSEQGPSVTDRERAHKCSERREPGGRIRA